MPTSQRISVSVLHNKHLPKHPSPKLEPEQTAPILKQQNQQQQQEQKQQHQQPVLSKGMLSSPFGLQTAVEPK